MNTSPEDPPTDIVNGPSSNSNRVSKLKNVTKVAGLKLKHTFKTLSLTAGLVPHLGSVLDDMSELVGILEDVVKEGDDLGKLFTELQDRSDALQVHITKFVGLEGGNNTTTLVAKSINKHIQCVKQRREKGQLRCDDAMKQAQTIEALLKRLHSDIELKAWETIAVQFSESQLARLCPVAEATYNSSYARIIQRGRCTSGTRQDLLTVLQDWARSEDTQLDGPQPSGLRVVNQETAKVFWMSGMAGTGKTTIAYSFCEWLEDNAQLGASFFCSRTSSLCQNIDKIIPTIAYQLGRFSPAYQSLLCKSLQENPDVIARDIQVQFEKLIVAPLQVAKSMIPDGAIVVIDALDECADEYGVEMILELLLIHAGDLPVRFFITSRPEPSIRTKMLPLAGPFSSVFHLHDIDASIVNEDIKKYFSDALKHLNPRPTKDQILQLAGQSGSLFIYASTVVRYICPRGVRAHSNSRLNKILEMDMQPSQANYSLGGFYKELDQLYRTVLELAFAEALEDQELKIMQGVLQTVVCAKEPVAIATLSGLLGFPEEDISYSLGSLHSVLHVPEGGGPVSTLHASFPDFLLSQSRAGSKHYCNKAQREELLTQGCFEVMKRQLRFNICNLESSFIPDNQISNLGERIDKSISSALLYACRFWGEHVRAIHAPYPEYVHRVLSDFLSTQLLLWMEVLNLTTHIGMGVQTLSQVRSWTLEHNLWPDTQEGLSDAQRFLWNFAGNNCSISTPHIYISALSLCPRSSTVYRNYSGNIHHLITDGDSVTAERRHSDSLSFQSEAMVHSVALFPSGTRIVSGTSNGVVQIWDMYNCKKIGQPLLGHSRSVLSVAVSPNGAYIASGSSDRTIRIWNVCDGTPHGAPLKGHTALVNSVAISTTKPMLLGSGSSDKTIRIWDLKSCKPLGPPLEGHTGPVNSVAFSPICAKLVSGSFDGTIRMWDTLSGTLLGQPMIGHLESVNSVAFSSDGSLIVSGSHDRTIRVWDASNGTTLGLPFIGHTGWIKAVAFGPDCSRIVSGSFDKTIRVWDLQTREQLGQPFEGHTSWVSSASFTHEGAYIVSSSSDKTIRLWDAYPNSTTDNNDRPLEESSDLRTGHIVDKSTESNLWDIKRDQKFDLDPPEHPYEPTDLNPLVASNKGVEHDRWHILSEPGSLTKHFEPTRLIDDSRRVTVVGEVIFVWAEGSESLYARIEPDDGQVQEIVSVAFSPDRIRIVVSSDRKLEEAQMWEVDVPMRPDVLLETQEQKDDLSAKDRIRGPVTLTRDGWLRLGDRHPTKAPDLREKIFLIERNLNLGGGLAVLPEERGRLERELASLRRKTEEANTSLIASSNSRLLFWLPPALHRKLVLLRPPYLLLTVGDVAFGTNPSDFNPAIGKEWSKCYAR